MSFIAWILDGPNKCAEVQWLFRYTRKWTIEFFFLLTHIVHNEKLFEKHSYCTIWFKKQRVWKIIIYQRTSIQFWFEIVNIMSLHYHAFNALKCSGLHCGILLLWNIKSIIICDTREVKLINKGCFFSSFCPLFWSAL